VTLTLPLILPIFVVHTLSSPRPTTVAGKTRSFDFGAVHAADFDVGGVACTVKPCAAQQYKSRRSP